MEMGNTITSPVNVCDVSCVRNNHCSRVLVGQLMGAGI